MDENPYAPPKNEPSAPDRSFFERAYRLGMIVVGLILCLLGLRGVLTAGAALVLWLNVSQTGGSESAASDPPVGILVALGIFIAVTAVGVSLLRGARRKPQ